MPQETKTKKRVKLFWIKERHNPQSGVYYVAVGQISNAAAKRMEKTLYGWNVMHSFITEIAYIAEQASIRSEGGRFV